MAEGHFARHLRRMRSLYAARRDALAEALGAVFGDRINLQLQAGGMHLIARFTDSIDDTELARRSLAHGLAPDSAVEPRHGARMRSGLIAEFHQHRGSRGTRCGRAVGGSDARLSGR